ncbi:MAG: VCBS repeat-containing protein [Planctomycetota bacterium]|jgi:hypothetical protein|nr:VCBS repeat-containing protein [Planctomycetota bacterium]
MYLSILHPTKRFSLRAQTMVVPLLLVAIAAPLNGASEVHFKKVVLDRVFRSEGVGLADVNHDGKLDVLAGEVWYAAPDWQKHELREPGQYDGKTGYSNTFGVFPCDVNRDGWTDSVITRMMGEQSWWYENPKGQPGHWKVHVVAHSACNETPIFTDLFGDGERVAIWAVQPEGYIAWFSMPLNPLKPWDMHIIAGPKAPGSERFSHGLGVGDINGDGRNDVLVTEGWWEGPEDRTQEHWVFHKVSLGPECSDMLVYDVDGDGDNDVITSSAHEYGMWWFEQQTDGNGMCFRQHVIAADFSQLHALRLADINRDGIMDVVTGKRYLAHQGGDPGSGEPAVVYWFEIRRSGKGKVEFVRHLIDDDSGIGTQFEVADINADGTLDIVTSNKRGVHIFFQVP